MAANQAVLGGRDASGIPADTFRALYELAVAIGGVLDPEALGGLVTAHAKKLLGLEAATLRLWDEQAGGLRLIDRSNAQDGPRWREMQQPGVGLSGATFLQRRPVVVEQYLGWERAVPPQDLHGTESGIGVPLMVNDQAIGTLVVRSMLPRHYEQWEVQLLELLAAQVAPAFEAASLHAESERQRKEAQALAELVRHGAMARDTARVVDVICEQGRQLLGADYAWMALSDGTGRRVRVGATGHRGGRDTAVEARPNAITSRVLESGRTMVIQGLAERPDEAPYHTAEGAHTALATPLAGRDGLAGAFHAGWRRDVSISAEQIKLADALGGYAVVILESARAQEAAEQRANQLATSEARLRTLYQALACGVVVWDEDMRATHLNAAGEEILGLSRDQLLGRGPNDLWTALDEHGAPQAPHSRPLLASRATGQVHKGVLRLRLHHSGKDVWLQTDAVPILREDGSIAEIVVSFIDITARKDAEEELRRQALHDGLTGLPNRVLLYDRVNQAILSARRDGRPVVLMFLDLDRFKDVNDTLGHQSGDRVLRQLGPRLKSVLRLSDTVGRLGGDEFAVVLPGLGRDEAPAVAAKIAKAIEQPLTVDGRALDIRGSIGIACFPEHGDDAQSLMRSADVAMYAAKQAGCVSAIYDAGQDPNLSGRLTLTAELRRGIEAGELELAYQPKINCSTGTGARVEALVRWRHPERGLIGPSEFVPLAEETGLIRRLTAWVLETAARQCHAWHALGMPTSVAINVSGHDLEDPDFPQLLEDVIGRWQLAPSWLRLEVTESMVMGSLPVEAIQRLSDIGIPLSIDDFGTGYSSLARLKSLPIDEIKIDKAFVIGMKDDPNDRVIVRSTIELAHSLGKQVVAEGVEDRDTWRWLVDAGCDAAQGFYLGRPMSPDDLRCWAEAFRRELALVR